jgi:hypothetical protein
MSLSFDTGGGRGFTLIPKDMMVPICLRRRPSQNAHFSIEGQDWLYRLLARAVPSSRAHGYAWLRRQKRESTSMPGKNANRRDSSASESVHLPLSSVFSGLVKCAADAFIKFFDLVWQAGQ